jgi:hypothetical protein
LTPLLIDITLSILKMEVRENLEAMMELADLRHCLVDDIFGMLRVNQQIRSRLWNQTSLKGGELSP